MKKLFFILLFLININVYALEVKLDRCIDGDTARFIIDGESKSFRFLAIDAPEMDTEAGKISASYTCDKLKKAKKIEVEYDPNSDKHDKYDRHLAWIFVDDNLLQVDLVKNGYAKVAYLYGDYKYTHLLYESDEVNYMPTLLFGGLFLILIILIIYRKQIF